ncbi:outer membrane beta-barrel protein [Brumimicrobium glaciale]|nr:outer membrane beta-barrel protein [Brumimicrobium glaciale]
MKNILFITVTMLFLSSAAFSQFGVKAGFAIGNPLNKATSDLYLGFDFGITYEISEKVQAEVLFESLMFKEKNYILKRKIMPITVGVEYRFLTEKIQPYVGLNLGIYNFTYEYADFIAEYSGSEAYLGVSPKVGISVDLTNKISIDATVKYHLVFDKNDKNKNFNESENIYDMPLLIEQKNTTIFGANVGLIYKFN